MSAGLRVLVQPGDGLGFRLAGVPVEEIETGAVAARVRVLLDDPALAVLAIDETLLHALAEPLLHRATEHGRVVVLPFVMPHRFSETGGGQAYLAALIRRAVGYHIKLGEVR